MAKMELTADSVEELAKGKNPEKQAKVKKEETPATPEKPRKTKTRKIDEMTDFEQIALHSQRNTYAIQKADKEARAHLYATQHVFVEEGEEEYLETEATIRKEEWLELVASAQENHEIDAMKGTRVLKGVITSITEIPTNLDEDDPKYIPQYMAKVRFKTGCFNVSIPSYVLYYYNYADMNRAMASDIQKNMMRRLNAEIDFVVRYADEKTGQVIGDRLAALSMRGVRNYASINGRKPRVMVGDLVQAKIIAIAREYITVDAAGAEIRIPIDEISWLYMADAREFDGIKTSECYRVGSRVNVKILSAEIKDVKVINSKYKLVFATASIKQAKPNPRIKYFDEFKVGDIHAGTITGITESGVYVNIDNKMDCLCKFPNGNRRMPIMGENVIVKINLKDEEKKFIYGSLK